MPITPGLNLPFGIQPVNPVPVDSNYGPYIDLADAVASIPLALRYDGLTVQITGSGNYWWLDGDLSDLGLVPKVGGGGALPDEITITTNTAGELTLVEPISASNGLTYTTGNITLGGALTQNTDITAGGTYSLNLGTISSRLNTAGIFANTQIAIQVLSGAVTSQIVTTTSSVSSSFIDATGNCNITLGNPGVLLISQPTAGTANYLRFRTTNQTVTNNGSNNRMVIEDWANNKGFVYLADYSVNFTPESLVTKRYVDNAVGGSSLSAVLTIGNTTGANDIIVDTTQVIKSGNGGGQIDLDYLGGADAVVITTDNGVGAGAMIAMTGGAPATQLGLFWNDAGSNNGFIVIDDVGGTHLSMNTFTYIKLTPAGDSIPNSIIINTPNSFNINVGNLKIVEGNQGLGKVLTSDALGNATWQTPSGGNPPDNVTIILNTAGELVVANPYPGPQGLTSVLTVDNSTTGYNIVLTGTDQITSSSLTSALALDDGFYGTALGSDGPNYGTAWFYSTGNYNTLYEYSIKNNVEFAAVDVNASNRARTIQYTTKGSIDAWTALDYINIESRSSISIVKYDWDLDDWQGGLIYSGGGGTGSGWELFTTETYQKGLNIVNDLAFYLDGGGNAAIDAAVDKVLVTKGWVNAQLGGPALGLPGVLAIDNTTGAYNISINTTQKLTSTDGVNVIDLTFDGFATNWSNTVASQFTSNILMTATDGVNSQILLQTQDLVSSKYSKLISETTTEYGAVNSIGLESYDGISAYAKLTVSEQGNGTTAIVIEDSILNGGASYAADYSLANIMNPRWITDKDYVDTAVSNVPVQILSPDDKFLISLETIGDNQLATSSTITNTPVDGCYVEVKYNGVEYEVGNGVTSKVFYFSGDGGVNARGFFSGHANGQVQSGDELYFNGTVAGFNLASGARLSLLYMINA
jgi:hypothetical protein